MYTADTKKRKLETQRIGDFIVKAAEAVHFRITPNLDPAASFFSPKFTHQVFGEQERIMGYEGLSVDIHLSAKYLVPFVQVTWQKKAPAFANVDNIE